MKILWRQFFQDTFYANKKSDIWNYFDDVVDGKAPCKLYRANTGCRGGSTN